IFVLFFFILLPKILKQHEMIMKRFSLILGMVLTTVFASCSLDEEYDTTEDSSKMSTTSLLVQSITATSERGATVVTDQYTYNGTKLVKITSTDGREVVYTYGGDLIIRKDFYLNNVLNSKEFFEYSRQGQLLKYRRENASGTTTYNAVYTNNSDGTVIVKGYSGSSTSPSSQIVNRKVFTAGIRVNKIENYTVQNGTTVTEVLNYSYDSKNSPFKNITGFDKLAYYDITANPNYNNVQSVTSGSAVVESAQYVYNGANYPLSADKGSVTFDYVY
ncbi:hypothetical protein, partial [Flavobacterium suncheonense]|uniref:hypothetical protein n=1 Tax=Flavobacterium suncheonense TaxID=350894 RepID=UPI003FA39AE4